MKCHYEVLGVSLDVDTQTLRAAYKKLALKWHPDKNLENVEKAKEEFQLVQQAFEVLSDPHERAWYDDHREAILKGGIGKDYKDDSINLFQYFSSSCYHGYGDDDMGFYAIYRDVFDKLFAENVDFDPDEKPDSSIPTFGMSDSSYEEVVHPFYAYWENYSTKKTFAWLDEFDIREAPNRRVMRMMEKENRKIRDKAKKQRNEEIRQLVRFVRKRDKRLEKHRKHLEDKAAENALKVQMNRLRQLEERKREIAETTQADWAKMHNFESELQEIENNLATEFGDHTLEDEMDGEDDSESMMSHLYCVACNKIFKNEKSFANHESSKKHKENVAALHVPIEDDLDDSQANQTCSNSDDEGKQDISLPVSAEASSSKKKGRTKKVLKPLEECHTNGNASGLNSADEDGDDGGHFGKSKKQVRKKNKKKNSKASMQVMDTEIIEEPSSDSRAEDSQKHSQASGKTEKSSDKKQKKKKQADIQNRNEDEVSKDLSHTCAVCNSTFPSKNKLFSHLVTTGHAVYLPNTDLTREERSSKSKNRNFKC